MHKHKFGIRMKITKTNEEQVINPVQIVIV